MDYFTTDKACLATDGACFAQQIATDKARFLARSSLNGDYHTVKSRASAQFTEKKSEFIGTVAPVTTAALAIAFVAEIAAANPKAAHNVYAYVLRGGECKCSDNGEPQGTGGVPTLEVIKKQGLVDVCVVVTRYFGGILLGAGGLVRAYGSGARLAIDSAKCVLMQGCLEVRFAIDYALYGKFSHSLAGFSAKLLAAEFGAAVEITLLVKTVELDKLSLMVMELTNGQVCFVKSNELYREFE